jgi:hypothetical protein
MVWQHEQILALLIDCVCRETDVRRIKDPTRGIAHSHVRQWYQRKVGDRTASEPKTTVKRFCHVYGAMLTAKETL